MTRVIPVVADLAERLLAVGGVQSVALGGSRAAGTSRPDSDWDVGLYYRGRLDVDEIRALGLPGELSEVGGWGGGLMNGGGWLTYPDGTRVDLIYRDLDAVERCVAEAEAGRFWVERLPFYLAGIPSYVPVGELAGHALLGGTVLPRPAHPPALAASATRFWHASALASLDGAEHHHLERGDTVMATGCVVRALVEEAHARLAARGEWVLNEKRILERAGLAGVEPTVAAARAAIAPV